MGISLNQVTTNQEIDLTAQLAKEIWNQHYGELLGMDQVNYMLEHFQSAVAISKQIHQDGYIYKLVYFDNEPCGFCATQKQGQKLFLSKIYIKQSFRKRGIARFCIEDILSSAKGLSSIYLTVNKYNTGSIASYKKLGFEIVDSAFTDIGGGFAMDDYIMEKLLEE